MCTAGRSEARILQRRARRVVATGYQDGTTALNRQRRDGKRKFGAPSSSTQAFQPAPAPQPLTRCVLRLASAVRVLGSHAPEEAQLGADCLQAANLADSNLAESPPVSCGQYQRPLIGGWTLSPVSTRVLALFHDQTNIKAWSFSSDKGWYYWFSAPLADSAVTCKQVGPDE